MTAGIHHDWEDSVGPVDLISDPLLLERWLRALGELASVAKSVTAAEDWPAYADAARAQLGTGVFDAVLGDVSGPSDDSTDELTDTERRRVRRALDAAVRERMPDLTAVERLAIMALVLYAVQARAWDSPVGDQGWLPVVGAVVEAIDKDDIPDQLSASAASWAATAVYLMHEHRPTTGRLAEARMYEEAAAAVEHLFPDADAELIAGLATAFSNKNGYPVDPDAVTDLIGMLVQDDPLAEAIDTLDANHPAWSVHKHNDMLLHVDGEFRATFLPAAEALEAMPGTGIAAVFATGSTPGWTLVIREADSLIRIERNPAGQITWWHYRLGGMSRPTGIARDPEIGNRARIKHGPLNQPFPEAVQAMTTVGASPADPPSECPEDDD